MGDSLLALTPALLLLVAPGAPGAGATLDCYFDANTTHLTELPKVVSCTCALGEHENFNIYDDILSQFNRDLISCIESISISDCASISLDLSAAVVDDEDVGPFANGLDAFSDAIDVEVTNVESVELTLRDSDRFLRHLFMENVAYVETLLADVDRAGDGEDGADGGDGDSVLTTEELYFYVMIVLAALLLITWTAIPVAVACSRRGRCHSCCCPPRRGKRVSRAESWRYESNIYVNPERQRHQQQRLLNQQQQQYSPTSSSSPMQQVLPYHLLPQSETHLQQQQRPRQVQPQHLLQQQQEKASAADTADSRRPLVEHVHNEQLGQEYEQLPRGTADDSGGGGRQQLRQLRPSGDTVNNQYTDTSLQYVDDTDVDEDESDRGGFDEKEEENSNTNSASYGSRNNANTMPLNQPPAAKAKAAVMVKR